MPMRGTCFFTPGLVFFWGWLPAQAAKRERFWILSKGYIAVVKKIHSRKSRRQISSELGIETDSEELCATETTIQTGGKQVRH